MTRAYVNLILNRVKDDPSSYSRAVVTEALKATGDIPAEPRENPYSNGATFGYS
jgi:hypothetical protein